MTMVVARNVHQALPRGLALLRDLPQQSSRAGAVVEFPGPVLTHYTHPRERVLFWAERDANPFFHFMESMWMLAGRRDLRWVEQFNPRMREYSDDGFSLHGAYGWRWREFFGQDQLDTIVRLLRQNPADRRVVLQMWDTYHDLDQQGRDFPCNTQCYFKLRAGRLWMTVSNRSNDIVWGLYGANAVHFSMLQEYLADRIGVSVGSMVTLSDSFHAYVGRYEHLLDLPEDQEDPYSRGTVRPFPLGADHPEWMTDLRRLLGGGPPYETPFFVAVAHPLLEAWSAYKAHDYADARAWLKCCAADDWRLACEQWLARRPSARGQA